MTGPLAIGDVDGDGRLDLLIGGHFKPGHYPLPATSVLYRDISGKRNASESNRIVLTNVGLVTGCVMTDLNGDARSEVVLSCEWGPLRVFQFKDGTLVEQTDVWRLSEWTGCWQGVTAGDFDGDGQMDLVASNMGLNTRYQFSRTRPWRLYAGDFDGNGTTDILEAFADAKAPDRYLPWRALDVMRMAIPSWRARFPAWRGFAAVSLRDLLGEKISEATVVEAATLESRIFMNRGGYFESRPLPREAQWAPAFGVSVADFNGDGSEDLFLAQNRFDLDLDSGRADAGAGLCLLGDGKGEFRALGPLDSGIAIMGQQRGAAVADFDQDGRIDLCVTQNNERTRLFRNTSGHAGLRVRLNGPMDNPAGLGARLRVVHGNRKGPTREIHAGSGYWSCDSPVQVMTQAREGSSIEVMWPGRPQAVLYPIALDAREVLLSTEGTVKVVR